MPKDQYPQDQKPPKDEGIPSGEAGKEGKEGKPEDKPEDKLIAGRYKSLEDAEKGARDADTKIRNQGKTIKDLEARIRQREEEEERTRLAQSEKQNELDTEAYKQVGEGFRQAFSKGAEEAGRFIYGLIESHPAVQTGRAVQQQMSLQQRHAAIYAEMKKRHSDYDTLIPKMREVGGKLSREMMVNPSMELMETIYKAAKAETLPDEVAIRKKIAEEEKAGTGQGAGERHVSKPDERTEEERLVDKTVAQYKKDKPDIG